MKFQAIGRFRSWGSFHAMIVKFEMKKPGTLPWWGSVANQGDQGEMIFQNTARTIQSTGLE